MLKLITGDIDRVLLYRAIKGDRMVVVRTEG